MLVGKTTITMTIILAVGTLLLTYSMYMDRTTPGMGGMGYAVLSALSFWVLILPSLIALTVRFIKNHKRK